MTGHSAFHHIGARLAMAFAVAFLVGLAAGIIPAVLGARNGQRRLGLIGLGACALAGLPCASPLAALGICIIFVWLILSSARSDLTKEDRTRLRKTAIRASSIMFLVFSLLGAAALVFFQVFVTPQFEEIFTEFTSRLPRITEFILSVDAVALALTCGAVAVMLIAKEVRLSGTTAALVINVSFVTIMHWLILAYVFALYAPIFVLGEAVSVS